MQVWCAPSPVGINKKLRGCEGMRGRLKVYHLASEQGGSCGGWSLSIAHLSVCPPLSPCYLYSGILAIRARLCVRA